MQEWSPDQLKKSLDQGKSVFLKLWKHGCGACKLSESATKRLEADFSDRFTFISINVDDYPDILEIAEVETIPAFFVFEDKKLKSSVLGFKGLAKLKELLE